MKTFLASCVWALCGVAALAHAMPEPMKIEAVECRGNAATSCAYIREQAQLEVAAALDEREIEGARFRLAALPHFAAVDIYLLRGTQPGHARVVVEVVERDPVAMEFTSGTAYYVSSVTQRIAGRVAHQNVFGTGKILEVLVDTRVPVRDPSRKSSHGRIQYVDPTLGGASRYYFIAGVSASDERLEERNGSLTVREEAGVDIAIGRRLWNYSYVALGYRYNWESRAYQNWCLRRDPCDLDERSREHVIALSYGWNSEDDPYFPTQGSRLSIGGQIDADDDRTLVTSHFGFRKTWSTPAGSLFGLHAGGTPGTEFRSELEQNLAFAFTYARPIATSERFGIRRGRWYLQGGWDQVEFYRSPTEFASRLGVKAGVRLDTKSFGVVDLYVMAVGEATLWGG